jgi:YHS domain-containing protein
MSTLEEFTTTIRGEIEAAEWAPDSSAGDGEYMAGLAERTRLFGPQAGRIIEEIVRPRVEALGSFFPNSAPPRKAEPRHCTRWFGYCERFPASVKLEVSCSHDEEMRNIHFIEEVRMVPSFMRYERFDRLVQPADRVDFEAVTQWVEARLIAFLRAYLQVEVTDRLQSRALATDPVCHMRVVKDHAAGFLEHDGHRFYFCAPSCREQFAADPERFAKIELEP